MSVDRERLARIILSGATNDIEEWRLGDTALAETKGYPREFPAELIDDWGIVFVDIVLDRATGTIACHEVNGPNAVGSDALTGNSALRAMNESRQAIRRAREMGYLKPDGSIETPVVAVHAHQHWKFFRTGGEFYPRVARFADCLADALPGNRVNCFAAGDRLEDDDVSVVMGDVGAIAEHLAVHPQTRQFEFRGRPVIFLGNPNLLSEMIRTGKLAREERHPKNSNLRVLHAWRLSALIHDKGQQQELFANTGIRPLRHFSAHSIDEAVLKSRAALAQGPIVLKPSDTSGGVGVQALVAEMSDGDIRDRIDALLSDCRNKYGDNTDTMVFPLRGFEFVRSTGFPMDDGEHLWDLRIAVLFEPGKATAYPVSFRLTPAPFDEANFHRDKRKWVSNVSGRRETNLKSGMDEAVLEKVGMTDTLMEQAMRACVRWTEKAWDFTTRDGGKSGSVYEDFCEEVDKPFYRGEKFIA